MNDRAFIFDLDGTLVDSADDILGALRNAILMTCPGLPVNISSRWIGPPISEVLQKNLPGLSSSERDKIVQLFREKYDGSPMDRTVPYPGVGELLGNLRDRGIRLFIATNKPQKPTALLIARHFSGCIDDYCCIDSVPDRKLNKTTMVRFLLDKHALNPRFTAVVGDGISDIEAALENGCQALGVSYGYSSREALSAAGAQRIFDTPGSVAFFKEFQ